MPDATLLSGLKEEATVTESVQKQNNSWLKQALGIAFAGLFLWLAFRGTDPQQLWHYVSGIQPIWLVAFCISGVFSHVLRAIRWVILLEPLSDHKISLWNSFCAVMLGYAVNVVVPRGGEVARLVSISRSERLPWAGVLSTMFIDRLLDIALLVLFLAGTLMAFPKSITDSMPWLVPGGVSLSVATIIGLFLLPQMGNIMKWMLSLSVLKTKLPSKILDTIKNLSEQFDTGTKSLRNPVSYPAIAGLSLAIWFFYWLNFYLMICAFQLQAQVSPLQTLIVFTIGSIGVLVPTPGNVGSFHFLVSQGLILVSGINQNLALAVASTLHLFSFIIVTCIPAAICMSLQTRQPASQQQLNATSQGNKDSSEALML